MRERIHSIDAIRGLCLVNIFINHVTLGSLNELSPSKIAFCDSADIFVFVAGVSTFIAYGSLAATDFAASTYRMWRRAFQIYLATLTVLGLSFFIYFVSGAVAGAARGTLAPLALFHSASLAEYVWNAITLQQSIGYSIVLRLYVFLMIVAPLYVWLALQRYWYPLVPAFLIWIVSGHTGFASRDSLTGELLSMTLFPWQGLFASGVALGAALAGNVPLPRSRALSLAAILFVAGGTLILVAGPYISPAIQGWIETRNDFFWTGISKSFQSPLRVFYLFGLVYLFLAFPHAPVIRLLHQSGGNSLINRLGRNSLEVFAAGAILAVAIDQILWLGMLRGAIGLGTPSAILLEMLLFVVGVLVMKAVADFNGTASTSILGKLPALQGKRRTAP